MRGEGVWGPGEEGSKRGEGGVWDPGEGGRERGEERASDPGEKEGKGKRIEESVPDLEDGGKAQKRGMSVELREGARGISEAAHQGQPYL